MKADAIRIAVDVGGTFTDLVAYDPGTERLRTVKVLTDTEDRSRGVLRALAQSEHPPAEIGELLHGTTAGTNAVIERTAPRTAVITTAGFRDVLELMRGDRPMPVYDTAWRKPEPLVPRDLRFEVAERVDAEGGMVRPLDEDGLARLLRSDAFDGVEAVAICFLHSFMNDAHELRAAEIVAAERPDVAVSISSRVNPEVREYERVCTTVLDAMLKPLMGSYLRELEQRVRAEDFAVDPLVMFANAGVAPIAVAEDRPIFTLHSGPAGGVVGAGLVGQLLGRENLITADMGGTSFDVCAIVGGRPRFRSEGQIEWGLPFRIPVVDVTTIGAGGGSEAWIDAGGLLRIGPSSAGADPGPVAYGLGGTTPTITDAFVVLGYLGDEPIAGGAVQLDREAAVAAIEGLGEQLGESAEFVADAILQIAMAGMAAEIRKHSVERGDDPREFSLFSFGGAGSMLAGALARLLEMPEVIVPPHAGVFSAFGMLGADLRFDVQRTYHGDVERLDPADLERVFVAAETEAAAAFEGEEEVGFRRRAALRYVGQRHEIEVDLDPGEITPEILGAARAEFDAGHLREYGHHRPGDRVEIRALAVSAVRGRGRPALASEGDRAPAEARTGSREVRLIGSAERVELDVYDRAALRAGAELAGPAILSSDDATVVVYPGQVASVDRSGALLLREAA
ncbi:MAG: hydantoinase/oxoprolinase family protein [Actinobacteria bacterium]|nr:hydantoinase/oxoprolinase family protein [Actinomycetota bacterium]